MLQLTLMRGEKSGPLLSNETGALVCTRLRRAHRFFPRMVGLLGSSELESGNGLWLTPSNGVHTFGMRYAIDVVALDSERRVLQVWTGVLPRRLVFMPRQTRSVLELAIGTVHRHNIAAGDLCHMGEQTEETEEAA